MRNVLLILVVAACGGSPHPVANPPSNTTTATTATTTTVPAENVCTTRPDPFGPWQLTAAQAQARIGAGVTQLASIETTQQHAIEVCGVGAENTWLASSTCADGSHPYRGPQEVEQSRKGDVGAGGRCGGIIDLYAVKCPEKTYEVYLDMYLCGPGESFM